MSTAKVQCDVTLDRPPLRFRYHGELPAEGVVGIYGRNGAGKTTFIRLLAASVAGQPVPGAEGRIMWPGQPPWQPQSAPGKGWGLPGLIAGSGSLFPHLTVRDNLLLAPGARQPTSVWQTAGGWLSGRASAPRDPELFDELVAILGLEPLLARRPRQLSAGEYQRAEWARTLLLKPAVAFLDEPFAHLDHPSRSSLLPYLAVLAERFQLPVYWISHNPHALIEGAGYVAVIAEQGLTGVFLPHQFAERIPGL